MDWRREDWTYAAATVVAAALVVYVIAGNFGLVPSAFRVLSPRREPALALPIIATTSAASGATTPNAPAATANAPSPNPTRSPHGDTGRPTATITTAGGLVVGLTEGASVSGTANDAGSGIKSATVTFDPDVGTATTVAAKLSCTDSKRQRCTWSADAPAVLGTYHVTVTVTDRAGNRVTAGPTDVTVVNTGGALENPPAGDENNDPGLVADLLGTVGGLLR